MSQEEAAEKNGIALVSVDEYRDHSCTVSLLDGEIPGAEVFHHSLKKGEVLFLGEQPEKLRTLLVIDGAIALKDAEAGSILGEKCTYVAKIGEVVRADCLSDTHILEILWQLDEAELNSLFQGGTQLPMIQEYKKCSQYREEFKTKKSISRAMIDHHALPGFCMGSNESYGPDLVGKHAHPLLDQFFFSFEENDVDLLIDDMVQPYKGNTLIHIPLGSDHGVSISGGKKMHYVWIDFMVGAGAVSYLDDVHKKTGVLEEFNGKHQIVR
ncbi:MAG TPA: hypothetical protein DF613_03425 [Lachnospiraceae bacterium]|nr:hypothetical protein [Lachnospiraceae bacterium]